ncbi:MAG TPA: ABC transporter ATP-binding protein [bacterium]|nr:ABC transporter ATP-binding protein [bacterium]
MSVLRFEAVSKVFRSSLRGKYLYTLGPIDLGIEPGEIFGYLGPNGAGKTTTLKLGMGLLRPSSGKVLIFDRPHDSLSAKRRVGFLPEQPYFYQHLTAVELLEFYGDMFGLERHENRRRALDLIDKVGLRKFGNTMISKFSKGMLQRIGLAQALVNEPDLVVLDEPMSGLDPIGRREIRDLILDLKARGKTVFLSSHILQDVEMICDRVGIISAGKILEIASVADLLDRSVESIEIHLEGIAASEARDLGFTGASALGDKTVVTVAHQAEINLAIMRLVAAGARVAAVLPLRGTLEDYFMRQVVGGEALQRGVPGSDGRTAGASAATGASELVSNAAGKQGR